MNSKRNHNVILQILSAAIFLFVSTVVVEARTVYTSQDGNFMWNNLWVLNNQWGREKALNADWYQRVVLEDNNTISFEYKWDSRDYYIMGYPALIAGWHWGYRTPMGAFGLPSRVGDKQSYIVSANLSHKNDGNYPEYLNVSWDIWLGTSDNPSEPNCEIMVWSWYTNQIPDGKLQGQITACGTQWDVYRYKVGIDSGGPAWNSFAFLRKTPTLEPAGNLGELIGYLRSRGWLQDNDRIVGIEFGTELGRGQGSFRISNYSFTVPATGTR